MGNKSGIDGDIRTLEAKKEDLLKLKKGSANMSLSGGKGEVKDFSTWTALDSNRDGNCFLNSFSLLMKGDQSLSTELRVRMCIFLMNNPELIGGFTDDEKLKALTLKLIGERDRDGKTWTLAKKGEWLATDDISILSDLLQRPVRVLYKPRNTQFKDNDAFVNFSKITGGWGKLEYYEPDTKTYKKTDYWTVCHIGDNHFEPLISPNEDKALPPTEINIIFTKLINGVQSVIRGEVQQSEFLMSRDFENQLALLDKETYKEQIREQFRHILFKVIGFTKPITTEQYEKLPNKVQVIVDKIREISKLYNGNGETAKPDPSSENYVDIYFEVADIFINTSVDGGSALLMLKVAKRPDGEPHRIGNAWKNDGKFMNVYDEKRDIHPGKYTGKKLETVNFSFLDEKKAKEIYNQVKNRGSNHAIFHVKGEMVNKREFKKGAEIDIEILLPL